MSQLLWRLYLEDDVETLCQVLENASAASRTSAQKPIFSGHSTLKISSSGTHGYSPIAGSLSYRKPSSLPLQLDKDVYNDIIIGRAEVNRRDGKGMSLLHYAASSSSDNARTIALALIACPVIDLYQQDTENGWTALHRCFYFGNITIARAILEREAQDILGEGQAGPTSTQIRLIKVKDREGYGPFDLLTETVKDRTLHHHDARGQPNGDDDEDASPDLTSQDDILGRTTTGLVHPSTYLSGDEVLNFGSNRNVSLGLGNEDDRQYPERVVLRRPEHLFRRFLRARFESRASAATTASPAYAEKVRTAGKSHLDASVMPSVVQSAPTQILDVQMSKFHTAVLTTDPSSNLFVTGHGRGGRLGTGNEQTQFNFVCVEDFAGSRKRIISVALGQDHTMAVTDRGELFTWGSNVHGQLGTGMSRTSLSAQEPPQFVPKQLFGPLKKELIIGVAASRVHSVAHTSTALYTWGKNDGQLGIVDANAATLELQSTPRHVAPSRFSHGIQSVSAMDRATVCLLENHEVHVFANYGMVKLAFPLDGFTNYFLRDSIRSTRYDDKPNTIVKVTCGGDTICALASSGEIFAVTVDQRINPGSSNPTSTTNPNKIRAALSFPATVWSLKKGHMNARDVGVDQDGSIILTTQAGGVWRQMKRSNLPGIRQKGDKKARDYKFSRVPGLTRVIAVRASGSGAYASVRRDCNVTREQSLVERPSLWADVFDLLPLRNLEKLVADTAENPAPNFWTRPDGLKRLVACLASSKDPEADVNRVLRDAPNRSCSKYDAFVTSTVSDLKMPVHSFLVASRSTILTDALATAQRTGSWDCEVLSISVTEQGTTSLLFKGLDSLTLIELVLYIYTDAFVGFWLRSREAMHMAHRYRQIRVEIMKVAGRLDLRNLESAARRMAKGSEAEKSLDLDLEVALGHWSFFDAGDVVVQLADGEQLMHSDLISRRCPFFEGLFQGRTGGGWLKGRLDSLQESEDVVSVDFTHVELSTFRLVLRHLYADTGEELFDDIVANDLDEYLDIVLDVLSLANELMLNRLSQVCQWVLGQHVNVRNVCSLLNAVAPSAVTEIKTSALEYICLNLEAMLTNQYLDELDEDLLYELDQVVRDNQLNTLPFVKSGRAEALLLERHPELAARLDRDRQVKLDALYMQVKYADGSMAFGTSLHSEDDDGNATGKLKQRRLRNQITQRSPKLAASTQSPHSDLAGRQEAVVFSSPTSPLAMSTLAVKEHASDVPAIAELGPMPNLGPAALTSDTSTASMVDANLEGQISSPPSRPWDLAPATPTKLGMKEIMEQTPSSRKSGIALGLASQAKAEAAAGGSYGVRLSQKERRRQLSQQQQAHASKDIFPSSPSGEPSLSSFKSPWQTVARAKSPAPQQSPLALEPRPSSASLPKPTTQRASTTPHLTMRQTVSNVPQTPKGKERNPSVPLPRTPPTAPRNVSGSQRPAASSSRSASASQPTSSASKPVEIQSIRHTPRPDAQLSPSFYMHQSIADIVAAQEAEKTDVKEAVAKRSLQEIQQEQEFLSWWDAESKRAIDEEAAASRAVTFGRGGGARRGRRGPRRGRGGKEQA